MQSLVLDSVTQIPPHAKGRAVIAASHGGIFSARSAARAGVAAAILHDAGVGREQAGITGLQMLDALSIPAATVSHRSARIGDGMDCLRRGVLSFVNESALRAGVSVGQSAASALALLEASVPPRRAAIEIPTESRRLIAQAGDLVILALDSNSMVSAKDRHAIVMTGSHGGLLGGREDSAIKHPVIAAAYNDADIGIDEAGVSRLSALDALGICAFTVSAWSARVGDGLSTYEEGYLTRANTLALRYGAEPGLPARQVVARIIDAWHSRKAQ